ncbi:MAG: hypothetical protein JWO93_2805 [Micrococcaceae bacterium]|nr:hypothetical protein [Micrococcaceae bacterium]
MHHHGEPVADQDRVGGTQISDGVDAQGVEAFVRAIVRTMALASAVTCSAVPVKGQPGNSHADAKGFGFGGSGGGGVLDEVLIQVHAALF